MAWVNHSMLSRLKLRFALDMPTFVVLSLGRGEVQILQGIGHGSGAVDSAKLRVHTLVTQPFAHRGTRFDRLHADAGRGQFVSDASKHLRAVHIYSRRR